mmetsp:Transcript_23784/g.65979  ORF Transcript_23784/g.65979 Transcript_23784/m.65979 type:complete len:259 (-) Transcript_23784:875-1651(-)
MRMPSDGTGRFRAPSTLTSSCPAILRHGRLCVRAAVSFASRSAASCCSSSMKVIAGLPGRWAAKGDRRSMELIAAREALGGVLHAIGLLRSTAVVEFMLGVPGVLGKNDSSLEAHAREPLRGVGSNPAWTSGVMSSCSGLEMPAASCLGAEIEDSDAIRGPFSGASSWMSNLSCRSAMTSCLSSSSVWRALSFRVTTSRGVMRHMLLSLMRPVTRSLDRRDRSYARMSSRESMLSWRSRRGIMTCPRNSAERKRLLFP